jgi:hypothetical protein
MKEDDVSLQTHDLVYDQQLRNDAETLLSDESLRPLVDTIEADGDVEFDPALLNIGADLVFSDERINERSPRILSVFAPRSSESVLKTNDMGQIFALTIEDETGDRIPAAAAGVLNKPTLWPSFNLFGDQEVVETTKYNINKGEDVGTADVTKPDPHIEKDIYNFSRTYLFPSIYTFV